MIIFLFFQLIILNKNSVGADFGCGTGRWSEILYKKVKQIYCVEPSKAINVAKEKLNKAKKYNLFRRNYSELFN